MSVRSRVSPAPGGRPAPAALLQVCVRTRVLGRTRAGRVSGQACEWVRERTLHGGVGFVQTLEMPSSLARFSTGIATQAHPVTAAG